MVIIIVGFGLIGISTFAADPALAESLRDMQKTFTFNAGQSFVLEGVNCHSTSLNKAGFINYPTYVDLEELNYAIDNFCKKIPAAAAGAVAVIDRNNVYNNHSYFHLTTNSVFEKKDKRAKEPYRIRRAGNYNNVEYFKCEVPANTCDDRRVLQLEKRVRLTGLFYANLVMGKMPPRVRTTYKSYLKKTLTELSQLSVTPRCAVLKEMTLQRGASLSVWARQLETLWTQFIPRNP